MRRGHPSGGWRNENQRHFGPRPGGTPRFRPPRSFGPPEGARFPPSGPRFRGQSRSLHLDDRRQPDNHDRNLYREPVHQNNFSRSHQEHVPRDRPRAPLLQQPRHTAEHGTYSKYYDDHHSYNVNNMGDVDHRNISMPQNREPYNQRRSTSWVNPNYEAKPHYNDHRSPSKGLRDYNINEGSANQEYTGHRPPASDHYSATPCSDNNNTPYSCSVDDTVDIVRRRLLNREAQPQPISPVKMDQDMRQSSDQIYQNTPSEQPVKRKIPRQKQNIKSNCDKMKNKIVHQLFKMDKDKIHKLMDNPSSSSKFEFAISSLITESQNSLHRHQRAIAERSLCSSSSNYIDHDNTIYEDTFMKQMQCILDPQDTILLEDIKPLVLAELNKVLQIDEFDGTDDPAQYSRNDSNYQDMYNEEAYTENSFYGGEHSGASNNITLLPGDYSGYSEHEPNKSSDDNPVLFERRKTKSNDCVRERKTSERSLHRKSTEKQTEPIFIAKEEPSPFFDPNTDHVSEDEDPFAELDNQYHVAVDPTFIETEDIIPNTFTSPVHVSERSPVTINIKENSLKIRQEIDSQMESLAKSPIKLFTAPDTSNDVQKRKNSVDIKKEIVTPQKEQAEWCSSVEIVTPPGTTSTKTNHQDKLKPLDYLIFQSNSGHKSRKRSIDQKPEHRKEKRKKSAGPELTVCQETIKQTNNAVIPDSTKCDAKCSGTKKVDTAEKGYSEKYVKRRDSHRKSRDSESSKGHCEPVKAHSESVKSHNELAKGHIQKKVHNSNVHHTTDSPKDNSISRDTSSQKSDAKTKLKTIDMFMEQPKKSAIHQPLRNTSTVSPADSKKTPEVKPVNTAKVNVDIQENKVKLITPSIQTYARRLVKRHIGTQVALKFRDKDIQTEVCSTEKDVSNKLVQTEPVSFSKINPGSKDPFERMKEIDLEIQVLLQEKFRLYSSIESKDSASTNSMGTLGMTVFNVPLESQVEEKNDLEDAIVEDFTNIPVEELEEIALEAAQNNVTPKTRDRRVRALKQTRKASESPTTRRASKKAKTPNISLLEQIITDNRPIEDIISLDDLECTPVKSNKKPPKTASRKKNAKRVKLTKSLNFYKELYNIKECSVSLLRTDVTNYIKHTSVSSSKEGYTSYDSCYDVEIIVSSPATIESEDIITEEVNEIVEESVVNDLQIDMLDVSEDIVIGEHCTENSVGKDDIVKNAEIREVVILDNSQSSMEDAVAEEGLSECKIFDFSADENLRRDSMVVSGNADAVLAIECIENHDNEHDFIAACLDGNVYHFRGDGHLVNTLRGSNHAVTCLTIVRDKFETTVYTGSLDSRIRYYDLETGLEKGPECNVLSPIQTMDRAWDTVFVGTRTGFVLQFECKNNMLIPVSTVKFSEQSILALRAIKEGPRKVLLVAARSENVTIKDAQTGLLLRTLDGPKMTVYTLLFEDGKVYCGTSSHQIHVFDYASGSHVGSHEGGKGAVCLRATRGLVFAGCYDGCVYVYREGETRPLAQLRGPSLMLLSLAVVGGKIIAGYKDRSLYIWKIPLAILQEMIL